MANSGSLNCPECGSLEVVDGHLSSELPLFRPKGLRWFSFYQPPRLERDNVACGCMSCGLVWSRLKPDELRAVVEQRGSDKLKARLSELRKEET